VNSDNGRSGDATKAVFNKEEGKRVFELIRDMHRGGTFYHAGQNWDDMRAAFQVGKVAMYLDLSAGVKTVINHSPFDVGVSYLPVPDGVKRQGVNYRRSLALDDKRKQRSGIKGGVGVHEILDNRSGSSRVACADGLFCHPPGSL